MVVFTCIVCGVTFKSGNKNAKYCSKHCQALSQVKLTEIKCGTCSRLFKPKNATTRYCSRQCVPQRQKTPIECICQVCSKVFYSVPARIKDNRGKYCSRECFAHRTTVTNCKNCGNEITVYLSDLRTNNFCNSTCRSDWVSYTYAGSNSPSWRGGCDNYRGDNWKRQRRAALSRDGYTCTICNKSNKECKLMVHHKIPFRFFTDYRVANTLDNLQTLCNACHSSQESHLWAEVPLEFRDVVIKGNTNIEKRSRLTRYSGAEIQYMLDNYLRLGIQGTAEQLNRSKSSIHTKALELGLRLRLYKDNTEGS